MQGAFWPSITIAGFALPIIFEPDFGSVMVVGAAGYLVMFVAGVRFWHMVPFIIAGGAFGAFKVLTNANRVARLFDSQMLYQVKMALAAIGNGGIWGVGMGESMQKQFYLPEAHTDFVFAIGAEEFGLFFSVGVLMLFCAFFALSVYIARKASDRFGRFLVVGMAFIVFFQAMFNLGVVCKALPTKGMALPFFSYGGTNMLCSFFAVGTIMSVGIQSCKAKTRALARKVLMRN
jgi:cell division protein FtsW